MARSKVTDKVAEDSSHSVSVVDQNPKLAEGGGRYFSGIFLRSTRTLRNWWVARSQGWLCALVLRCLLSPLLTHMLIWVTLMRGFAELLKRRIRLILAKGGPLCSRIFLLPSFTFHHSAFQVFWAVKTFERPILANAFCRFYELHPQGRKISFKGGDQVYNPSSKWFLHLRSLKEQ